MKSGGWDVKVDQCMHGAKSTTLRHMVNLNIILYLPDPDEMIMRFDTEDDCLRGQSNRHLKYNGTTGTLYCTVQ